MPTLALSPAIGDLNRLFRGLADPTRLRILNLLAAGELCVCDLVGILKLPQPTVSRHLAYLRRTGLVEATRETRLAHYRLSPARSPMHRTVLACARACFHDITALGRERKRAEMRSRIRATTRC